MHEARPGTPRWFVAPDADAVPRHQAVGMAVLRVLLGLMWLYNVSWKRPPGYGLRHYLQAAVDHPVLPPYSYLVEHLALPHVSLFGPLVLALETALGVLLLSGSFVRVAALLGIAQSLAIGLSVAYAPGEWPWSYWLMVGAHVAVLVGSSGRVFSVDARRAGASSGVRQRTAWGVVALVVGLYSAVASLGDPLAASGPGLRSSDLSMSLGRYNLVGALVVVLVGVGLLLAARGSRPAALAAVVLGVLSAVLLTAQIGFTDPLLGGDATSVALLLTLAAVAVPLSRRTPESRA